ncbi:hypothetical protein OROMI_015757 [Orobanche minor]
MGASSSVTQKSIHDFNVKDSKGNDVNLDIYKGKVLLVVNVASKCGFTDSNYTQMTTLYSKYKDKEMADRRRGRPRVNRDEQQNQRDKEGGAANDAMAQALTELTNFMQQQADNNRTAGGTQDRMLERFLRLSPPTFDGEPDDIKAWPEAKRPAQKQNGVPAWAEQTGTIHTHVNS